jgi:hypothetical protein
LLAAITYAISVQPLSAQGLSGRFSMDQIGVIPAALPPGHVECWPNYNVFRRRDVPDLYCAVPEDRVVPPFIGGGWEFTGRFNEGTTAALGFRGDWARSGVHLNGYYLFFSPRARIRRNNTSPLRACPEHEALSRTTQDFHEVIVLCSEVRDGRLSAGAEP